MVENPQEVVAKYLIDSSAVVDGSGVSQADARSDVWYVTSDKMPEFDQNWVTVKCVDDVLQDKPVREKSYRTRYYAIQLLVKAGSLPEGRVKGVQIADLLGRQLYNAVVSLDGRNYRLQNFSETMGGLTFLKELERTRQQLFALNGTLTMWEI